MKVLIADQINEKGIDELKDIADVVVQTDITPEELVSSIPDYDAIVVRSRTGGNRSQSETEDHSPGRSGCGQR